MNELDEATRSYQNIPPWMKRIENKMTVINAGSITAASCHRCNLPMDSNHPDRQCNATGIERELIAARKVIESLRNYIVHVDCEFDNVEDALNEYDRVK